MNNRAKDIKLIGEKSESPEKIVVGIKRTNLIKQTSGQIGVDTN